MPQTPGDWRYLAGPSTSTAAFGGNQLLMICNRQTGTVTLVRAGAVSGGVAMSVSTSSTSRSLVGQGDGATVSTALPARDSLLDAMAFSRGRFAVETAGLPALYLPSYPEVARVIEDCR